MVYGVSAVDQRVKNPPAVGCVAAEEVSLIPCLEQWLKDLPLLQLWRRSQLWLRSNPWLWNFHMLWVKPWKNKNQKKKNSSNNRAFWNLFCIILSPPGWAGIIHLLLKNKVMGPDISDWRLLCSCAFVPFLILMKQEAVYHTVQQSHALVLTQNSGKTGLTPNLHTMFIAALLILGRNQDVLR